MCKIKIEWTGLIAAIFSITALVPLIHVITIKKKTKSVLTSYLVIKILGFIFLMIYSMVNKLTPTIIISVVSFIIYLYLLGIKWYYELNNLNIDK
jgi:uncharacterized protein with PQ loop repeat